MNEFTKPSAESSPSPRGEGRGEGKHDARQPVAFQTSQGAATKNLWPVGIILTFILFISGTVGLVVMACAQKVDLVSPDYYEQEIRFQNQIDSGDRAQKIGATITYEAAARQIRITIPKKSENQQITGSVKLYRPSSAGLDQQLPLKLDSDGTQKIDTSSIRPGLWKIRVTWTAADKEFFLDRPLVVAP